MPIPDSKRTVFYLIVFGLAFFGFINNAEAQRSITLSISPPLFKINVEAGDLWSSSLKVINNNPYDITVYPNVVIFEPDGEGGSGRFTPRLDSDHAGNSLAYWIKIDKESFFIPREQSVSIPFRLVVPEDASPGGHYAAILVGTRPPDRSDGGASVGVSSFVTSLFLVRVGGDVIEGGVIREFSTDKSLYSEPEANLNLRFENSGNVHIIPRGEIVIENMWGKERGRIGINESGDFGNVLPQSIRKFSYTWRGGGESFDIGRYKATVRLSFGSEKTQSISKSVSFWVVPLWPTLKFLGFLVLFIAFIVWSVKIYVRRALAAYGGKHSIQARESVDIDEEAFDIATEPIKEGFLDLSSVASFRGNNLSRKSDKESFIIIISKYKKFILFCGIALVLLMIISAYFTEVTDLDKDYMIMNKNGNSDDSSSIDIRIISSKGSEEGERIYRMLESRGMPVSSFEKSSDEAGSGGIIIRYLPEYKKIADRIDLLIGGYNVVEESLSQNSDIVLIVGDDVNTD